MNSKQFLLSVGLDVLEVRESEYNMDFIKMSDKKLKEWIAGWEEFPLTRHLCNINVYTEALKESFKRFNDESHWKIEYFKQFPEATIEEFYSYFREI